ncbi:GGDEF domain-containing protein [Limisalsivibrio acetivorans]|uniref:GGDEF domain-containing protein n=1 Tax=Limisalsivibrio acetivorans TaxID=1304888 RepID=UPI0003B476A8|nr:diguanylate cyclase response regulator [Limisalsivibrio acetivorans]
MSEKPVKILIIEDNPGDARLIEVMLEDVEGCEFAPIHADKLEDGMQYLSKEKFDVVLLDLALPDSFGMDSFYRLSAAYPDVPVVVLTGNDDESIALSAVREGAQDYLVKGQIDEKVLNRSVNYAIERQKTIAELHKMSFRDELTKLNNRRGFMLQAEELLKVSRRANKKFAVFFIDLDGMKWINDNLGHKEGDNALIDTADIMMQTFRESDILSRLGGDEFAAAMLVDDDKAVKLVRDRFDKRVKRLNESGKRDYTLSISIGVAFYNQSSFESLEELMDHADDLMYEEKKKKNKQR